MLKVYGRRSAFNVQKVLWLIGELGLEHEHHDVGGAAGGLDAPAFKAMNPHGRIPVIDDGGRVVWESHTILRYLAARHARAPYWQDDAGLRARAEGWMDWTLATLQPDFLRGVFWGFYRTPIDQRDMEAVNAKVAAVARHMAVMDDVLAGSRFLAGDRITLADIAAGTAMYRYFNIDIARPDVPHVERWYRELIVRHAYQQHVMVRFDDLFGRLDY
ncbi:MAG: glutathione S-transferase [Pseudomonadota bacterium]